MPAVHRAMTNASILPRETKHRTLIQAAVLLVLLVIAVATNKDKPVSSQATAQVANSE